MYISPLFDSFLANCNEQKKIIRSRQDSNLRGQSPSDFESDALTTRPRLLSYKLCHNIGIGSRYLNTTRQKESKHIHLVMPWS